MECKTKCACGSEELEIENNILCTKFYCATCGKLLEKHEPNGRVTIYE